MSLLKKLFQKYAVYVGLCFCISILWIVISLQFKKSFGWDELEHIHSSFLVSSGKTPFIDFFQHHHPILWYGYTPFLSLSIGFIQKLWLIKIISILVGLCNGFLLYRITKTLTGRSTDGVLATVMWISSSVFMQNGMEIRPDNLMLTCILINIYSVIRYSFDCKRKWLIITGIFLGLAGVILQKAIVFIPFFNIIIVYFEISQDKKCTFKNYLLNKRNIVSVIKKLTLFNSMILIPFIIFLSFYLLSGTIKTYFFLNWTLNSSFDDYFSVWRTLGSMPVVYLGVFILTIVFTFMYILFYKKLYTRQLNSLYILIIGYCVVLLVLVRSPYMQYLLPLMAVCSIVISVILQRIKTQFELSTVWIMVLYTGIILVSIAPLYVFETITIGDYTFDRQIHDLSNINQLSESQKKMLKVQEDQNIFFDTNQYYWFSPDAQHTIRMLNEKGKVPEDIIKP